MINVIDSIMGSGKTSWAIQYMKSNKDKRFVFVTPYLTEVERIEKECGFIQPISKKEGGVHRSKLEHFKYLVENGINISTTHTLFKSFDIETLNLIRNWDYVLILDEVLDVISMSTLKSKEIEIMEKLGIIKKENSTWIKGTDEVLEKYSSEWKYEDIVKNLMRNSLEIFEDKVLIWLFPIDIISCFKEVYILTYLFDGYPLKPYLELHNIPIKKYSIIKNEKVDYIEESRSHLVDLITVCEGKINDVGDDYGAFTVTWYDNIFSKNADIIYQIRKNITNFYNSKMLNKSKNNLIWTSFKDYEDGIIHKYNTELNFISHNIRATNNYSHIENVIYLVNRNYNPLIKRWLISKNLSTDDHIFALSEAIQLIWRSAIRNNKKIVVYIPSSRIRDMFLKWLNDEKF